MGAHASSITGLAISPSNNQAFSLVGYGGGIGNDGNGVVTISNSTVQNNSAGTTGGGYGDRHNFGTLTIQNSFFSGNTATGNGGGIAAGGPGTSITNSEIDGNTSGGSGGGVFANGTTLTIQSSTLANNTANSGALSWKVSKPATTQARIRVSSVLTPSVRDTSDGNFIIK